MRSVFAVLVLSGCGRISFDPSTDASSGAGDDDALTTFCDTVAPTPTLCADFDRGDLMAGFDATPNNYNGGTVALTAMARSTPSAFDSSFANPVSTDFTTACLEITAPGTVSVVSVEYDVFLLQRPTQGHMETNDFAVNSGGINFYFDLDFNSGQMDRLIQEEGGQTFMSMPTLLPTISAGAWHHVRMALDLGAMPPQYTLELDGSALASGATAFPVGPGTVTFQAGINYEINSTIGNTIYEDNIVFRATP